MGSRVKKCLRCVARSEFDVWRGSNKMHQMWRHAIRLRIEIFRRAANNKKVVGVDIVSVGDIR